MVTIKSLDPSHPAIFTGVSLYNASNISFDSVKFNYASASGASLSATPFQVINSSHIAFDNSTFAGDLAHGVSGAAVGLGTGQGLWVRGSTDVAVANNNFINWWRAASFNTDSGLTVTNNDMHGAFDNELTLCQVQNVVIENNYLHDMNTVPSLYHPDMIQFWTSGTTAPTKNVVINSNYIDSGGGPWTQSIDINNELVVSGAAGVSMDYQNLTISNNVIHNAHLNAIKVAYANGLQIENNTLLYDAGSATAGASIPSINLPTGSENVIVANNIIPGSLFVPSASGWQIQNNLFVQTSDPHAPNYVGDLFVNGLSGSASTLAYLDAMPGGLINQLGVGSSLTHFNTAPSSLDGFVVAQEGTEFALLTETYDASHLYGPSGAISTAGASVVWNFGDGATGTGLDPSHTYLHSGTYNVTATVHLASGQLVDLAKTVRVQTPVNLDVNFNSGSNDLSDLAHPVTVSSKVTYEPGLSGNAVRLNGGLITYKPDSEFFNNPALTVMFDFKKDASNVAEAGMAVVFLGSFFLQVNANGVTANLPKGGNLIAKNVGVNDANWHRVALTFSGDTGVATLYVDGSQVAQATGLAGAIQRGLISQKFYVGSPWNPSFGGLIDNVTFLRGAITADQAHAIGKSLTSDPVSLLGLTHATSSSSSPSSTADLVVASGAVLHASATNPSLAGDDTLISVPGLDKLTGGLGHDTFMFKTGFGSTASGKAHNFGVITDFSPADDTIALSHSVFHGLHFGTLAAAAFFKGASPHTAAQRIGYDPANGALTYYAPGHAPTDGVEFAKLTSHLHLTHNDFLIV
jgi:PKD repeat protein